MFRSHRHRVDGQSGQTGSLDRDDFKETPVGTWTDVENEILIEVVDGNGVSNGMFNVPGFVSMLEGRFVNLYHVSYYETSEL